MGEHGTGAGLHRRSAVRTAVVWDALQPCLDAADAPLEVVDLGGGTGGFAVRVAESGHHVTVVDPSPDALASLDRRAVESGVSERIHGVQGDASDLARLVPAGSVDLVLCHGVLEVVDEPAQALRAVAETLRADGRLSLLVAQRHAAVLAKALTGHLADAARLLAEPEEQQAPRRFTEEAVLDLLAGAGFRADAVHAVRVFTDLVPSALVDGEPGAVEALLRLEAAVAEKPEFRVVATQLHLLATRA